MNLFDYMRENTMEKESPLASRMRPETLEEVVGQRHILGKDKLLYRAIKADKLGSVIFYGPPGTGKTTLARVIANTTSAQFRQINATVAGKKDMEDVVREAKDNLGMYGKKTILFVDEIHRFNKGQQDYLLPYVEDGTLILIGATTENPFFEVNGALLSRSRIFELKPLEKEDVKELIRRAVCDEKRGMGSYGAEITDEAADFLADAAGGDARAALNAVELGVLTTDRGPDGKICIDLNVAQECIQKRAVRYDKSGDSHYDTISAFIKSMRGSDPDAALYYLARMLYAGEDIKFIARRIMICAAEDVGMADPQALNVAVSASLAVGADRHAGGENHPGGGCDLCGHGSQEQRLLPGGVQRGVLCEQPSGAAGAAPSAGQALRGRGQAGAGAGLQVRPRLPQPLCEAAVSAGRNGGNRLLPAHGDGV